MASALTVTVTDKVKQIKESLGTPPVKFEAEQFNLPMKVEARPAPFEFWEAEAAAMLVKLIKGGKDRLHIMHDGRIFHKRLDAAPK